MLQPKKKFTPIKSGYKALIIDIDGTLMVSQRDALPTEKVTKAIRKASKKIHIGVATQRDFPTTIPIIKHLGLTGPSILAGGAIIIDGKTFKIIKEEIIDKESLNQAIQIIKEYKKYGGSPFLIQDADKGDQEWNEDYTPTKPFATFIGNLELDKAKELENKLSKIPNISVHKVEPWEGKFGVVVNAALATKQHGIFEVAKILGINTHEIIGVGDSYNDFPLLMACGLKVAMGNAVPDLKAIADYIAPTVEEDGVVDVINKFIL